MISGSDTNNISSLTIRSQLLNVINIGIVILNRDYEVYHWNNWMAMQSNIKAEDIEGKNLFDFYPDLNTPSFKRKCQGVLKFGHFVFLSQKLHSYLFPFKLLSPIQTIFEYMQQSATMGPIRDKDRNISHLFILVQDVTEMAQYELKLYEMNIKDALTGVYNRRFLETRLHEEFHRHKRYKRPLSLIMLDIDYFKKINDTYGHQFGDTVLKNVAAVCNSIVRKVDIFARYGGEEFCGILPEIPLYNSRILAERLRIAVSELENDAEGKNVQVTISIGISEIRDHVATPDMLLKIADDALYKAKHSGRNKIVIMDEI
ncbi:PAS/PAC sensor-containing diguanylate cyclase [Candidatus Magnetoovum chiemensis]|nr:PAS/PAC sensor-containing diguanylate cyclase [Candidatus Magnetoovum chiemensis]